MPEPTGPDPRTIERIAEDEIAADQEQARDWVAPKATPIHRTASVPPSIASQAGIGKPAWWQLPLSTLLWILGLFGGAIAIVAFFAFVGGAPVATSTLAAVATPTSTPTEVIVTPAPEPTPTDVIVTPGATPTDVTVTSSPEPTPPDAVLTPSPDPLESPEPFVQTDPQVDEVLDDGTPVDDPKVDIVATFWQKLVDRIRLTVMTTDALVDPPSAAEFAYIGSSENVGSGIRLARSTAAEVVEPYHAFLWQVHDGVFTIGRVDPETSEVIAGQPEGISIRQEGTRVFFEVPFDQLPPIVDSYQVFTFHRAALDDPLRSTDETELIELPEPFRLP